MKKEKLLAKKAHSGQLGTSLLTEHPPVDVYWYPDSCELVYGSSTTQYLGNGLIPSAVDGVYLLYSTFDESELVQLFVIGNYQMDVLFTDMPSRHVIDESYRMAEAYGQLVLAWHSNEHSGEHTSIQVWDMRNWDINAKGDYFQTTLETETSQPGLIPTFEKGRYFVSLDGPDFGTLRMVGRGGYIVMLGWWHREVGFFPAEVVHIHLEPCYNFLFVNYGSSRSMLYYHAEGSFVRAPMPDEVPWDEVYHYKKFAEIGSGTLRGVLSEVPEFADGGFEAVVHAIMPRDKGLPVIYFHAGCIKVAHKWNVTTARIG